jgi:nitrogen fixation-related uncharacterized protein
VRNGQFEDFDGAAWRAVRDDDLPENEQSAGVLSPQRHVSV